MGIVTELIDSYPFDDAVRKIPRNEELLLTKPGAGPMKMCDFIRVEWQKMNARQPFYHRNADVDEISYHVAGERTVITEKGSFDAKVGDFARIPVSVAHDNRGIDDVHLLFYIPAPVFECIAPTRTTEYKIPPFEGWEPNKAAIEMMTECLGARGCDVSVSLTDESMLLDAAKDDPEPMRVLRATDSSETQWLYKSTLVWIGSTTLLSADGTEYKRHRRAEEIQCQIKGHRTLVTQRGTIDLAPGDFISIPLGTAFTEIVGEASTHISVLTRWPAEAKSEYCKTARETSFELMQELRSQHVKINGT